MGCYMCYKCGFYSAEGRKDHNCKQRLDDQLRARRGVVKPAPVEPLQDEPLVPYHRGGGMWDARKGKNGEITKLGLGSKTKVQDWIDEQEAK